MDFESMYRAIRSRDERFDGRFFTGVTSTGIYCRPSCPVAGPLREHMRFFPTAEAAEQHGFRACRRCRPEASPDSPDWDTRADLVGRALRLIADGVVDAEGVSGLARRLAVGSRQLHRQFVREVGTGPLAVARSRRGRLAKQLLEQTDLGGAEVAFAAGFSSIRSYNQTLLRLYGRTPTEIRQRRLRGDVNDGPLTLRLGYRPPLHVESLMGFLGDRAIPGVEAFDGRTFRRSLRTRGERAVVVGLTPHPAGAHVTLEVAIDDVPELAGLVQAARRLLDLDADPITIDAALAAGDELGPLVRARPGMRLPGAADGFELVVRAVLGQQIAVRAARTLAGRIVSAFGTPIRGQLREHAGGPDPGVGITHLFPTPERLADAQLERIGLPGARASTLRELSRLVAAGDLDLSGHADPEATVDKLLAVPGVGPWTAAYVSMRALRDPDAFPAGDLGIRAAFERLGLASQPGAIRERADRWRPWRAYAAMHLWHAEP